MSSKLRQKLVEILETIQKSQTYVPRMLRGVNSTLFQLAPYAVSMSFGMNTTFYWVRHNVWNESNFLKNSIISICWWTILKVHLRFKRWYFGERENKTVKSSLVFFWFYVSLAAKIIFLLDRRSIYRRRLKGKSPPICLQFYFELETQLLSELIQPHSSSSIFMVVSPERKLSLSQEP